MRHFTITRGPILILHFIIYWYVTVYNNGTVYAFVIMRSLIGLGEKNERGRNNRTNPGTGKRDREYFNRQRPLPGHGPRGKKEAFTVHRSRLFQCRRKVGSAALHKPFPEILWTSGSSGPLKSDHLLRFRSRRPLPFRTKQLYRASRHRACRILRSRRLTGPPCNGGSK